MRCAALAASLLLGCNQIYSLDETDLMDPPPDNPDVDADGVEDIVDVCPGIANPHQLDSDGDGAGDVCDACPQKGEAVDPHDEDADGIADVCDNCPGRENRPQVDDDGDGVGAGCDPLSSVQRRAFYDNFAPIVLDRWSGAWPGDGDAVMPPAGITQMRLEGLNLIGTRNRSWQVDVGVRAVGPPPELGHVAVRLTNPTSGVYSECGIAVVISPITGNNQRVGYRRLDSS